MGNYAAVDCGSLSTRLLVATQQGTTLQRLMRVTGLARGVDANGALGPVAVEGVLSVLTDYRRIMDAHDVTAVAMVGTSALRDAADRDRFVRQAEQVVGAELEVLTGEEEASLSFRGATAELAGNGAPYFMVDIGGGSTELAAGPAGFVATSLDVGCVRLTERHLHHDPPRADEVAGARAWLRSVLSLPARDFPQMREARTMIGLAGTVSALASFDQGLTAYDRDRVHHYRLERAAVQRALTELVGVPAAERAGRPGIEAARAPFIVGGALVLDEVMACFGFDECLVSEADILDGLVARLVERAARS